MIRLLHPLVLLLVLATLAVPAVAMADPGAVIRDCSNDEHLDGTYSKSDLRWARDHLPTDIEEYTSCSEVIGAALGNGSGKGDRSAKVAAAATSPSAGEQVARVRDQKDLEKRTSTHEQPGAIDVGGQQVAPGSNGLFDVASASNGLPFPLLLALIGLGLLTLFGGFVALRSRVPLLERISPPWRGRSRRPRR